MLTGGRIVVAVVGAVALAVGVFAVVGSLWWNSSPDPKDASAAGSSSAAASSSSASASSTESSGSQGDPGGTTNPGETSDPGGTGNPGGTTSSGAGTSATEGFKATKKQVNRILGSVSVDVELPQVEGPNQDVAKTFNDGMNSALLGQANEAGTLQNRDGSDVRIGEKVLSGLLATSLTNGAESTEMAGTVVVNAETGEELTLTSLFDDQTTGVEKLSELVKELGPQSNSSFDDSAVSLDPDQFEHWTADTTGMTVYFAQGTVAPASDGVVPVTIPWDELSEVINSSVAEIVSS